MQPSITKLFIYGSLRSGFRNPAYQYLAKYFSLIGPAVVKGKLLDKGTYPVAKPTDEEKFIIGELYEINKPEEFSWAIEQLDDYEGLNMEPGEAPLYKREAVSVIQNNTATEAWIYWYAKEVNGLVEIASGDVLEYTQQKTNI
jgi:gamma-glutamylcyclotransferase (GGCT)/AIG2-like uncharacterized protein YtfP